jgi:hypothetical protein
MLDVKIKKLKIFLSEGLNKLGFTSEGFDYLANIISHSSSLMTGLEIPIINGVGDILGLLAIIQVGLFFKHFFSNYASPLALEPSKIFEDPAGASVGLTKPEQKTKNKRKLEDKLEYKLNKKQKQARKYPLELFVIKDNREPDKKLVVPKRSSDNY